MRILVFSDTHLGRDFNRKDYMFLRKLISSYDKVIINGDFWDGYFISLQEFLDSKWKKLFPLLKSKQAVFIPGNHDSLTKKNLPFASLVTDTYKFSSGNMKVHVEHGHRLKPEKHDWTSLPLPIKNLYKLYEYLQTKLFGFANPFYRRNNSRIFSQVRANIGNDPVLILGHSHYAFSDPARKNYNCGFIRFGYASYVVVDHGKVTLYKQRY